jgi:hypothetical protein
MMNEKLFRETFSQLHASDEAKREVLSMIENKTIRRTPRPGRVLALAAALCLALAVTAGAVNAATDGMLFRVLWSTGSRLEMENDQGERVTVTMDPSDLLVEEDGRLILHAAGQALDITDELEESGSFRRTFTMEDPQPDGTTVERSCTVTVTGGLEDWTAVWDYGDGSCYTLTGGRD